MRCCCGERLRGRSFGAYGARRRPYRLSANVEEVAASDCLSRKAVMSAKNSSSQSSTLCRMGRRCANTWARAPGARAVSNSQGRICIAI